MTNMLPDMTSQDYSELKDLSKDFHKIWNIPICFNMISDSSQKIL